MVEFCAAHGGYSVGWRNRRGRRRLFAGQPRRVAAMASSDPNVFSSEYRPFTIIPPVSRPQRLAPLIIAGALIVLGAALIFVFARSRDPQKRLTRSSRLGLTAGTKLS